MAKKYTVTDGKLVLVLEPSEKGWYAVSSPFDPALITQAKSLEEAFMMAYDAQKCLQQARAELARRSRRGSPKRASRARGAPARSVAESATGLKPAPQ
jgi:predicted RNase H-like HicB family nuclease